MIFTQLSEQLDCLEHLLERLTPDEYRYKSKYLSDATIGGHTRHILELLGCAVNGYAFGMVDYQNRVRDLAVEQDIYCALQLLRKLGTAVRMPDKHMQLIGDCMPVTTSYYREIVYNIEHTIHHLALIKVSLVEMGFSDVNQNFGMAYATIKYNQEKAAAKPE